MVMSRLSKSQFRYPGHDDEEDENYIIVASVGLLIYECWLRSAKISQIKRVWKLAETLRT